MDCPEAQHLTHLSGAPSVKYFILNSPCLCSVLFFIFVNFSHNTSAVDFSRIILLQQKKLRRLFDPLINSIQPLPLHKPKGLL